MARRRLGGCGGVLSLAFCLLLAGTRSVAAQGTPSWFELVIELRIERGPSQVVFALGRDSTILIPIGQFIDLAEIDQTRVEPGSVLEGMLTPGPIRFAFDLTAAIAVRGEQIRELDPADAVWRDGDLFVAPALLEWMFDVAVFTNWTDLRFDVQRSARLPVIRRLEREQRRAALAQSEGDADPATRLNTVNPALDGATIDWAVTSSTRDPVNTSSASVGLGAQVFGGSLDIRYTRHNAVGGGANESEWSWVRAWAHQPWLRQLRAGEIGTTGRQPQGIRGVSVSNAPFLRSVAFGEETLTGRLPTGWEVELYRGNQFVGFAVVDESQRFGLGLPVQYGPNPVKVVAYGPHGEIIESEQTVDIPFQRLPKGQFEYGLSGGECEFAYCQAALNVDARYGVSERVTVQAGSDYFWRAGIRNAWHPYALVSAAAHRSLSFTGEAVLDGLYRLRADYAPTPDLFVALSQTWYDTLDSLSLVGSPSERNRSEVSAFWRPSNQDRVFFEFRGHHAATTNGRTLNADLSSTLRLAGARLTTSIQQEVITNGMQQDVNTTRAEVSATAVLRGPTPLFRSTLVRSLAAMETNRGFAELRMGIGRQIAGPLRLDLDVNWDRGRTGLGFNITVTTLLSAVRSVSRNFYTESTGIQGTQHFEGSVLWNRRNGTARFSNGRALGRAGLTGVVFFDENRNGVQEPNEPGVPNVRIQVATSFVTSDDQGEFSVWDLVPFEDTSVDVDTMSIGNPLWIPAVGRASVNPTPNSYQFVQIPLIEAGEVSGRVEFEDGRGLAGATVFLQHRTTGDVVRIMTFTDGTFYALGVRPGVYDALLPEGQLQRLGGTANRVEFVVGGTGNNIIDDIVIRVRR